jgi:hypothetical protein
MAAVYPEQVEEETIIRIKYQYYEPGDIRRALEYLVDRSYIDRTIRQHPAQPEKKIRFYKILPAGVDLVDGVTGDPGVVVEEVL